MDLGLNHVIRKHSENIDISAHKIVLVPGQKEGPGGALLCCENFLVYKKMGHADITCHYPSRNDTSKDYKTFIIASCAHKQKDFFFILL